MKSCTRPVNKVQRWVLLGAAILITASALFPPLAVLAREGKTVRGVGYQFLFLRHTSDYGVHASIDWTVLACEWGAILIVAALLYAAFRKTDSP